MYFFIKLVLNSWKSCPNVNHKSLFEVILLLIANFTISILPLTYFLNTIIFSVDESNVLFAFDILTTNSALVNPGENFAVFLNSRIYSLNKNRSLKSTTIDIC